MFWCIVILTMELFSTQLSNKLGYCLLYIVLFCKFINTTAYHFGRYKPSGIQTSRNFLRTSWFWKGHFEKLYYCFCYVSIFRFGIVLLLSSTYTYLPTYLYSKHLQNFDHPLNHFVSTSKKSKWNDTVQKFYRGLKIFEARKFLFFENFRIFAKFSRNFAKKTRNLATKTKRKIFSTESRKYPSLGREKIFPYRTVDRSTSKFCRWLQFCLRKWSISKILTKCYSLAWARGGSYFKK